MVTIEIFGLNRSEGHEAESKIFGLLRDQSCIKQLLVSIQSATSRNAQMINKPFLRISAVPGVVSIAGAIRKLREAGYKVQVLHLSPASESMPIAKKKKKKKKFITARRR